mgnify:FL=1
MGRFAGVIPSAGTSSRMGEPKGLLKLAGKTFLSRTVNALAGAGCDPVFVIVAVREKELAAEAARAGAVVVENLEPGEGPITSLRLVLALLDGTVAGVAYLPVDHPMVRPETVSALLQAARTTNAFLTVPMVGDKRGHPALFSASLFSELSDPSLEGGARTIVHRHLEKATQVQVDDPGVLMDIDTPEAYRAASYTLDLNNEATT